MRCTLCRWQLSSSLDRGRDPSAPARRGFVARHLSTCVACRDFERRLTQMHVGLRAGAAQATAPIAVPTPGRARPRRLVAVGVGAMLAVAVVGARLIWSPASSGQTAVIESVPAVPGTPETAPTGPEQEGAWGGLAPTPGPDTRPGGWTQAVAELPAELTPTRVLTTELDLLARDARRGVRRGLRLGGL
ncbi:hypothetical protein [Haliangium sp.]|uniref:hypothetical protein n=1 Tax=Haliangium sp. TaxID=2663208 RepID=UPI003D0C067B